MNCTNDWTAEQLSVAPCSSFICSLSALCPVIQPLQFPCSKFSFSWFCSCAANCDGVCCCSSTHVQVSNQWFASTLCFVLFWTFVLSSTWSMWLVCLPFQWLWRQHWFPFALTNHAPSKPSLTFTPHNHDWLLRWRLPAVLRFHFLLAAIMAPYLAPCPARALSMVDCALGNGVVHQNLGFLLTGTTSARSVSTRSRERPFPWVTTPHNHRREY